MARCRKIGLVGDATNLTPRPSVPEGTHASDTQLRELFERLRVHEREQAEAMRLLMESSGQGILTVGRDGTILAANPALESMLGWDRGELIGQTLDRLIPMDRRHVHHAHEESYWAAPRSRPMGLGLRLVAQRKDGSTVPARVTSAAPASALLS